MKLTHENYDQMTVMVLHGELTADQTEAFRKLALDRLSAQVRDFVLEISGMDFVDSKGLETILWLQDQAGEKLGQVRFAAPTESVKKIFEMTRLAPRFDCHPTVEAAIKSLR